VVDESIGAFLDGSLKGDTASIYDADGDKILVVPSFPYRRKSNAVLLAEKICGILNLHKPPLTGV